MNIEENVLKDIAAMVLNYKKICDHFNLTEKQMREIDAADKIIDRINFYERQFIAGKAEPQQ